MKSILQPNDNAHRKLSANQNDTQYSAMVSQRFLRVRSSNTVKKLVNYGLLSMLI